HVKGFIVRAKDEMVRLGFEPHGSYYFQRLSVERPNIPAGVSNGEQIAARADCQVVDDAIDAEWPVNCLARLPRIAQQRPVVEAEESSTRIRRHGDRSDGRGVAHASVRLDLEFWRTLAAGNGQYQEDWCHGAHLPRSEAVYRVSDDPGGTRTP